MKRTGVPLTLFVPASRRHGAAALLAVAAVLGLAACGTETTDGAGRSGADTVAASAAETPSDPSGEMAFMKMLVAVGDPCLPDVPVEPLETEEMGTPAETPMEGMPVGGVPPAMPSSAPGATVSREGQEMELSAAEECESRLHIERVGKELDALTDIAPDRVRAVLNRLDYTDDRISRLGGTEGATSFLLDLRFMGGQLCLSADVTPGKTVMEAYGMSAEDTVTCARRSD